MDGPKVFGEGVLTLALSQDGCRAYVGPNEVEGFSSVSMRADGPRSPVEASIEFQRSHDPDVQERLEEALRLARTLRWVESRGG